MMEIAKKVSNTLAIVLLFKPLNKLTIYFGIVKQVLFKDYVAG